MRTVADFAPAKSIRNIYSKYDIRGRSSTQTSYFEPENSCTNYKEEKNTSFSQKTMTTMSTSDSKNSLLVGEKFLSDHANIIRKNNLQTCLHEKETRLASGNDSSNTKSSCLTAQAPQIKPDDKPLPLATKERENQNSHVEGNTALNDVNKEKENADASQMLEEGEECIQCMHVDTSTPDMSHQR